VITYPTSDTHFELLAHGVSAHQQIVLTAAGSGSDRVTFVMDGIPLATVSAPFHLPWTLRTGAHQLVAVNATAVASEAVAFRVTAP
jgi:hypothetical protein